MKELKEMEFGLEEAAVASNVDVSVPADAEAHSRYGSQVDMV